MTKIRLKTGYRCHVCQERFVVHFRTVKWIGRRRVSRRDPDACPRCGCPLRFARGTIDVGGAKGVLLTLLGDRWYVRRYQDVSGYLDAHARTPAELDEILEFTASLDLDAWERFDAAYPSAITRGHLKSIRALRKLVAKGTLRGRLERAAEPLRIELQEELDRYKPRRRRSAFKTPYDVIMAAFPGRWPRRR